MRKRMLALLLAFAMVLGMMPAAAFPAYAEETETPDIVSDVGDENLETLEHSCIFDQEVADEDHLATAADCTSAATYYYSCTCGENGTEVFSYGEALGHIYKDNICMGCDSVLLWKGTGKPYARSYLHTIEMSGATGVSSQYSVDAEQKAVYMNVMVDGDTAADEELTFTLSQMGDYGLTIYYKDEDQADYSDENGVIRLSGVPETGVRVGEIDKSLKDGSLSFSLQTSWSDTTWHWYINIATEHTCAFDQKVVSETYLATKADCTHAATYYYSCTCGEKGTETFSSDELGAHNYQNGNCTVCGAIDPANVLASGTCGENLTWALTKDYALVITGTGAMTDYSVMGSPWYKYRKQITSLTLPDGLTYIGKYTFSEFAALTSVTVPASVERIGQSAFSSSGLTSVTLQSGLKTLDYGVFNNCTSLTSVTLPDTLTTMGSSVFNLCSGLTELVIPDSVTTIGGSAFYKCSSLTKLVLSKNLTVLEGSVLNCEAPGLKTITIPASVTELKNYVFGFSEVTWDTITFEGTPTIADYALDGLTAKIVCPCNLGRKCTSTSFSATNVTWELVHNYNEDGDCIDCLANQEHPDDVIGSGVFGENDAMSWTLLRDGTLTVKGQGAMPASMTASPWKDFKDQVITATIEDGITSLGRYLFSQDKNLVSVSIPDSVTVIGPYAFWNCESLKEVTIPSTVTTIDQAAFMGCYALTSVVIPDSVTTLGKSAFRACEALTTVTLPKGLTELTDTVFSYSGLTSIEIPETVTKIGNEAFRSTDLTSVTIGDNVESLGYGVFNNCKQLKSVTIGKKVASMGYQVFKDCSALEEVHFTGSVPTMGTRVFENVTTTVYYPCNDDSWTDEICTETYSGATKLTWVKEHSYEGGTCTGCGEVDPESAVNALSAMSFHSTYSATDTDYVLVPEFDPAVKEYDLVAHDSKNTCYAKATLAEDVEGTINAAWVNLNNNDSRTAVLTSSSKTLTGAVKTGNYKNTVVVTVTDGEDNVVDTYTVNIVRTPSLTALGLDGIKFNETFLSTTTAYTASTAAESVTVTSTPRDESYTVTVNGGEDATVALEMGENVIPVVVKNEDGYESTYTITVTRKEAISITFSVNVDNPRITLTDANKTVVTPVDGVYSLISGDTYSYTVQKDGYIGQTNTFTLTESGTIEIVLEAATENPNLNKNIYAEWANFRNGPNNLGITNAATPYAPEDAELLWAAKYGTGWAAAPGSPILVDGDIITYVGSTIKRLDKNTGKVVAEGTMVASSSYSIVPATYADGMIFVGLSGGRIQAFDAATLESLWVYKDELGGQPNCPITYKDGYIYAGFWNSEIKNANFACIYTIDEDHENTTESKLASWTYTRAGGFYWAGAYVSDKFAVVGTDDGASGYITEGASLLVFDRFTGDIVDSYDGLRGDIRSNVSYDPSSDRVFFTSKGGILCNAKVDWQTGEISSFHQVVIQDANGNANAMSTCTPSVYNGRIYIGVCGTSQFGDNSGHGIAVYDLNSDGSMTRAYTYAIKGYPQTAAMVTTAYVGDDDYVYIYLPYNSTPGGISVLKDKKGQTAPLTTTDSGYSEVFTPVSPLSQYCICSTIADQYGTIYYKNDSCYMMAITSKIESLELETEPTFTVAEDGEWSYTGLKAVTNQVNGTTRDVTKYVEVEYNTETGAYSVSYTYGFDNENYGLKTLTVYSVSIPEGEGYTVTGNTTAAAGADYTFNVEVLSTYKKTDAFAVKVNGEAIEANEDGSYTVKEVSGNLTITVEGLEAITLNITAYYADNGTIVVGDDADKTLLNFAPVKVTDANGDGKFTMYDGFYCLHEQYHEKGATGYTDTGWVSQFWSVETAYVSYGHNNGWVFSTAEEIAEGDSICLFVYQDKNTWSDLFAYFDSTTGTAKVGEDTSFTVNGVSFMYSSASASVGGAPVGATVTATKKDATDKLTTVVGADGTFTLNFPSDGTWTVLVDGKCTYTPVGGYAAGDPITDAPVTPAMMTVTVEKAEVQPITAYVYYATKTDGIVKGKDGTLLNYVELTVTDADDDGLLTLSDAFYALHEAYYEGGAAAGYQNGKYTMKFWGASLRNSQFERNGSNNNVFTDTAIEDGDMLAILGGYSYNCLWTHFEGGMDGLKATAATGEETTFHVTAYQANGTVGNVTLPVGADVTATCGDTTVTTTVDANGDFTLTFPSDGTYTVLVDGSSTVNGAKCSVIPAMMTVTAKTMSYSVTLPQGEGYTVTGETTAAAGEDYTFTVTITDGNEYVVKVNGKTVTPDDSGVCTVENVNEALVITVTEFSKIPQQDSEDTYLIENGYQLKWFADKVNEGDYEIDAKLVDDIDLSVVCSETLGSWTPIGNYEKSAYYAGDFDGQGHTISNLYMYETGAGTSVSTYYRGLFGQAQCGSIKNVNLTGTINTTLRFVGGLVGRAGALNGGLDIDNCHVDVDIVSNSKLGSVGGIAGSFRKGTISNCSFSGTMKTSMQTSAGGIVGVFNYESGTVTDCLFNGSITSSGAYHKDYGVGGIVGTADTSSGTYTIRNCANIGSISVSLLPLGGILGNQRKADVAIVNCYNAGTSDVASGIVGGILGQITGTSPETSVTGCYYLNTFATTDAADGSARTAEELKSNTMVMLLGDGFKKSNGTVNGGYPGLSWQKYDAPALPECLDVTLTSGTGYTLSGDALVASGDPYTVTIDIELGYETDETYAIKANGVAMTNNGDGSFTLASASEALTITVEGVVASPNAPVTITLTEGDGYTLTGETRVAYGTDYTFTLALSDGYGKSSSFAVKANGEALADSEDGTYTIENLMTDLVITVEGVLPSYTIKVDTSAAYTLSAYEGYAAPSRTGVTLLSDQDYKFIVTPNEGYAVRDNNYALSSGSNVNYSYEVVDDHAVVTVSYKAGDGTIFISGVKKIMNVTLPEETGYTITPGEAVADMVLKGETYTFTLTLAEGYQFGNGAAVKAGNTVLTANDEGVYSFKVNADTVITVTGVEEIPTVLYNVTLPEETDSIVTAYSGYTTTVRPGGTFKFTVEPAVGYDSGENLTVKANGEVLTPSGKVYTLENINSDVTITVEGMEKIIWEPVTVYFSISHDDQYLEGKESKEVMALRKISVPYFDLGLYGLEKFYFSSETYGSDGGAHSSALEPGTAQYAYGKITLLHLYIYSLEVYYCGLDESMAGQGYLKDQNLLGTDVLTITGNAGSLYMNQFWGGDENLNYYMNYEYPLASAGWGSTSDQILLRENDVITLGHFTSWQFFGDPSSVFNYLTPDEANKVYGTTTVTQGDQLTLTAYRAGNSMGGDYTTGHSVLTNQPTIYYTEYDDVDADFKEWTTLGTAGTDGTITIDTTTWEPGTYVVAMAGQKGTTYTDDICSTPGGILVVVEKAATPGDLNGDGELTAADITLVNNHLSGEEALTEEQLAAADVNGDGKVTSLDVALMKMYLKNKLDTFPDAQ